MNALDTLSTAAAWVLQTSLKASLLAILIIIVRAALRNRLPARWVYAFWLLLILRLAMPFEPESKVSLLNLLPSRQVGLGITEITSSRQESLRVPETTYSISPATPISATPTSKRAASHRQEVTPIHVLALVWLLGVFVLTALSGVRTLAVWKKVRGAVPIENKELLALLNKCKGVMNISASIPLIEVQDARIPLFTGILRPRILLPPGAVCRFKRKELQDIFLHELAHYKRCDIPVSVVTTLLQILHWFNPLLWYVFSKMRLDRELACDELALANLGQKKPEEYGYTIISLLRQVNSGYRLPLTAGMLDNKTGLKMRLKKIAKFKKPSLWWSLPAVVLLFVLGGLVLTGAKKAAQAEKPYASEVTISMSADGVVRVNGNVVPVDSVLSRLNEFRFDDNSIIALAPQSGAPLLDVYMRVQSQLSSVDVKRIKYVNTKTGKSVETPNYNVRELYRSDLPDSGTAPFLGENYKYGYYDANRDTLIEPQFDKAWQFHDGLAAVMVHNKWGFINMEGKFVAQPVFEIVHEFSEGLCEVKKDDKWGYIDKTGELVIEPQFDRAFYFQEGLAGVSIDRKIGFINKTGTFVIPPKFEGGGDFKEGLAAVKIDGKWGFIDETGATIIGFRFDRAERFCDGQALVLINGKYGYLDRDGQLVIKPQFDDAEEFSEGLALVKKGDKYGYIDRSGEFAIEPQFDYAMSFHWGMAHALSFERPEISKKAGAFWLDKAGNSLRADR